MKTTDNLEPAVVSILHEFGKLSGTVPPDKDLYSELGVQSVNAISILLGLEDKFSISINDTEFVQARTLGQLVSLVGQVQG